MIEVVSAIIYVKGLGFLFVKRKNKPINKYALPGGHVEKGEKWDEALSREVLEEIYLETKPDEYIKYRVLVNGNYKITYGIMQRIVNLYDIKFKENCEVSKIKISNNVPNDNAFETDKLIIDGIKI